MKLSVLSVLVVKKPESLKVESRKPEARRRLSQLVSGTAVLWGLTRGLRRFLPR